MSASGTADFSQVSDMQRTSLDLLNNLCLSWSILGSKDLTFKWAKISPFRLEISEIVLVLSCLLIKEAIGHIEREE